jgi:hypothetical protein
VTDRSAVYAYGEIFVIFFAFVAGMVTTWLLDPKGTAKANFDAGYATGIRLTLDDVDACLFGAHSGYSFSGCMSQRAAAGTEWLRRHPDARDLFK